MATTMANKEATILSGSCSGGCDDYDEFMASFRVLVVDDDRTCLLIIKTMLQKLLYQVTTCYRAEEALSMLREDKSKFDIIISNVHMPEMDGFKLLEILHLESMDLPVVMMSAEDGKDFVLKGVIQGACDYLVKPVSLERIKVIWQHVVRKKQSGLKQLDQPTTVEDVSLQVNQSRNTDDVSLKDKGNNQTVKIRKNNDQESEAFDDVITGKKPRVTWTEELHVKFVAAVNQLGHDKAVPKKILERMKEMNVSGLTRENVASHLQKYRLYLQRQTESPYQIGQSRAYMDTKKSIFEHPSSLNATSGKYAVPEATGFNSRGLDMPFVDQRTLVRSRITQSSFYPVTELYAHDYPLRSSATAIVPYTNPFSPVEKYEYMYLGDPVQHSGSPTMGEFKTGNMCEFISDQPLLHIRYFDDEEETLCEPFV